jgi:hypothetical protein
MDVQVNALETSLLQQDGGAKAEMRTLAAASLRQMEQWIERNGWAGYDPYDLRDTPLFEFLEQSPWGRRVAHAINLFAPVLARRVLGVRPQINAKAIGLLALGYLACFETTGQECYREKATACLTWLETNACPGYIGACWGYPFNWHTRVEIPAGTPSSVVSSIGGWAFLEAYRLFQDRHYLDMAQSTAEFFLRHLNVDRVDTQRACFSYTPLDHFHVHNANLFVAAHLYQIGTLTGDKSYIAAAEPSIAYTLGEQNRDGSWYYWGAPDEMYYVVDHYHTGFVLRCLDRLCGVAGRVDWEAALARGFQFYLEHLLDPSGLPKFTPERAYPVDIHSCAEAILCLAQLSRRYSEAARRLPDTMGWTLREMQAPDGHFCYRKYPKHTVRVAYMRWGQAWMFWALAVCL